MSIAKLVEHFKPPRLEFSLVYKTDKKLRSDWIDYDLVERKIEKWSDAFPWVDGIPPKLIGTCVFKYIVLKDPAGVYPLPLFHAGPVFAYIPPKNRKINLASDNLCHISHGFAWLYDDYGNVTKFRANTIKIYYEDFGFVIERYDTEKEEKDNTNGQKA